MTWAVIESKWAEMTRRVCGDWADAIAEPERRIETIAPAPEARATREDDDRAMPGA